MSSKDERLPLGAVRTAEGKVVVPASRRADGSTRKPIRIRQGYVPQDEVPKYKTVAQRRREQEAKSGGDAVVDELSLDKLSLEQKKKPLAVTERVRTSDKASHQERGRRQPVREARAVTEAFDETSEHQQQQRKRQLTKINKQLIEIAKLEDANGDSLTAQQRQKVARTSMLQQQRNDIIAELNGAKVTRSSDSATGSRPKVAISL